MTDATENKKRASRLFGWGFSLLCLVLLISGYLFYESEPLQDTLQERLSTSGNILHYLPQNTIKSRSQLRKYYQKQSYRPVWIKNGAISYEAWVLLSMVEKADEHGISPEYYNAYAIKQWLGKLDGARANWNTDSLADLELLLSDAFVTYASDLYAGCVQDAHFNVNRQAHLSTLNFEHLYSMALDSGKTITAFNGLMPHWSRYKALQQSLVTWRKAAAEEWPLLPYDLDLAKGDTSRWIAVLYKRLELSNLVPPQTLAPITYDEKTERLVKTLQAHFGLDTCGLPDSFTIAALNVSPHVRLRQIAVNMERLRWLPHTGQAKSIWLNTADFTAEIRENDKRALQMNVIVGKPYTPTPVFDAALRYVVINPYWDVPYSIATKEILPILRRDPGYIARSHMAVYKGNTEVNPWAVNWNALSESYFPYRIRQLPGTWNALGQIKFMFPNAYNVYMHGTPNQELFSNKVRTFSHGCIRVEYPLKLAVYFLRNNPGWTESHIKQTMATYKETIVTLPASIPVFVTYQTVWANEDGTMEFREDVYSRDLKTAPLIPFADKLLPV